MEVLPDPATPWMIMVPVRSLRMIRFCSLCMVAMMDFIFSSEVRLSSRWSTSSRILSDVSRAYSISPPRILNCRFRVRVPSTRPTGAS